MENLFKTQIAKVQEFGRNLFKTNITPIRERSLKQRVKDLFQPQVVSPIPGETESLNRTLPQKIEDLFFRDRRTAGINNPNKIVPTISPTAVPLTISPTAVPTAIPTPTLTPTPTATPFPNMFASAPRGRIKETAGDWVKPEVDTVINNAAKEFGVPSNLLYDIAFAESSLDPGKVGPTKDVGLFQFQPQDYIDKKPTGWTIAMKALGLPVTTSRTDPEINARAAAWAISNGYLSWWNASKGNWGKYYKPEEIKSYYPQTLSYKS